MFSSQHLPYKWHMDVNIVSVSSVQSRLVNRNWQRRFERV